MTLHRTHKNRPSDIIQYTHTDFYPRHRYILLLLPGFCILSLILSSTCGVLWICVSYRMATITFLKSIKTTMIIILLSRERKYTRVKNIRHYYIYNTCRLNGEKNVEKQYSCYNHILNNNYNILCSSRVGDIIIIVIKRRYDTRFGHVTDAGHIIMYLHGVYIATSKKG